MKQEERRQMAVRRLHEMQAYDRTFREQGLSLIAGIDEAGRGPLAGPVVAAAVILPPAFDILGVDDSKKISAKKREALFTEIQKNSLSYGIGIVDNQVIDTINILQASKLAMKQAVEALSGQKPEYLLIDAMTLEDVLLPQTGIIKGDAKSISIAAASILAKVTRDRIMEQYHIQYPEYGFDRNKGYGTRTHYEGIKRAGICPIHRKSFLKKVIIGEGK